MESLVHEFDTFTKDTSKDFYKYHKREKLPNIAYKHLSAFLTATMDEIRLDNSEAFSRYILEISHSYPLIYFRHAVLRRELFSDIDYTLQRDHSAHTLHNFLLGWYIFSHSSYVKHFFRKEFQLQLNNSINDKELLNSFGLIWPFVSLTHDIGYILEGGLESYSTAVQSKKVQRGAIILEDYFRFRIWRDLKIRSISERKKLLEFAQIKEPSFQIKTIASVASCINNIGDTKILFEACKDDLSEHECFIPPFMKSKINPLDAFDLWMKFYEAYGHKEMIRRINNLRKAYETSFWEGLPKTGTRLIDHGVASGLIALLADTFFFRFIFGLYKYNEKKIKSKDSDIIKIFLERFFPPGKKPGCRYWWLIVVWSTAATAIHNLQQEKSRPWPGCKKNDDNGLLKINEDPLAYLGILVDILEEWDRYSVMRRTVFTESSTVQSKDIKIGYSGYRITIRYDNKNRADKVIESLENALHGWKRIVRIMN